jgi:hypothetical protein
LGVKEKNMGYTEEQIVKFQQEYTNVCQGFQDLMLQTVVGKGVKSLFLTFDKREEIKTVIFNDCPTRRQSRSQPSGLLRLSFSLHDFKS